MHPIYELPAHLAALAFVNITKTLCKCKKKRPREKIFCPYKGYANFENFYMKLTTSKARALRMQIALRCAYMA